jgi:prepilin-type N-terminal cleavage/methylation domain-containing protein
MNLRQRHSGFTLIEVLATMILLAIVIPVAMRGVSISLAAADKAKHLSQASALAESKLNDLLTQSASGGSGGGSSQSGDFAPEHPEYHWNYDSVSRDYGVTEVQLKVTWLERGRPTEFNLCTMTYQSDTGGVQP